MTGALVARLAAIETAHLADAMRREGVLPPDLRPVVPGARMAGVARTAEAAPADADSVLLSVLAAAPGEVVVIACGNLRDHAMIGDLVAAEARRRGIAGIVVDAMARDTARLRAIGLPVYALGATPRPGRHGTPGRFQVPVTLGGVTVHPGDLIAGDDDGVIAIPAARAEAVIAEAEGIAAADIARGAAVLGGMPLMDVPGFAAYIARFGSRR